MSDKIRTHFRQQVQRLLDEGVTDPYKIAEEIDRTWDDDELRDLAVWALPGLVRRVIHTDRKTERMVTPVFVPEVGWKSFADLTKQDCLVVAAAYRDAAAKNAALATWYEDVAKRMTTEGAMVAGELAEYKKMLSDRTKHGLRNARKAGVTLGRPTAVSKRVKALITTCRESKKMSYGAIAAHLNTKGVPTGHGAQRWTAPSVRSVYLR